MKNLIKSTLCYLLLCIMFYSNSYSQDSTRTTNTTIRVAIGGKLNKDKVNSRNAANAQNQKAKNALNRNKESYILHKK
jgi:hypothetical protein